jgi:hypothetical protein
MAQEILFTGAITPGVRAAQDLRQFQNRVVVFDSTGVKAASVITSGNLWVLANKPNSGDHCSLIGPPNVAKVITNGTVRYNMFVMLQASVANVTNGCVVEATSGRSSLGCVGVSLTSVASGSFADVYIL